MFCKTEGKEDQKREKEREGWDVLKTIKKKFRCHHWEGCK
jgi:hypothetical protein